MGFICAICSDSLEKTPTATGGTPELDTDNNEKRTKGLSAVPCGHIFHTACINTWTSSGVPSSNLCPNCRKIIPRRSSCIELFPDSYDDNSSPCSPNPEDKLRAEQYQQDIAALRSKIYRVEADFKIQLTLYELLTRDHQENIKNFSEHNREKEREIATLKSDAANTKHQLELEVQKLKSELQLTHHKLEAERNGRLDDRKKQVEFCERFAAQIQAQRLEVLAHSLHFQRDIALQKPDEDLKPDTSRHCKPFKSRPSIIHCKPKRGKKMVYEKGPDSEPEIEELQLEDSDDDDDDIDIMSCPLDPRKRKLPRLRPMNPEIPKPKLKRLPPAELPFKSPITLTLSSDSEDEVHPAATPISTTNTAETIPGLEPSTSGSVYHSGQLEPITMDTTDP